MQKLIILILRTETARSETSEDILKRALLICPTLAGPGAEGHSDDMKLAKLRTLVKAEVVGFRPTRRQGIRLEHDRPLSSKVGAPIIHNYGHGGKRIFTSTRCVSSRARLRTGYGWQSCWGSAEGPAAWHPCWLPPCTCWTDGVLLGTVTCGEAQFQRAYPAAAAASGKYGH